ncbi:MAG: IS66 family insertion sequence element accessory protein TnpB [Myxococcota bacterium]
MVVGLPPSVKIYFAVGLVDMRNGIDGLRAIVENTLKRSPDDGHLFVFVGKSRDKVKILFWDKNGYVVYFKRLEKGRFQLPAVDGDRTKVEMEAAELAMLLDGIDLNAKRLQRWKPSIERTIDTDRPV